MLMIQILLGGITRLTGSGLSITKWEIVIGSVPPLNQASWENAFDLYKESPQYQRINQGMSLSEFKFIFFWEFIHRFWARIMGFVFLIPFIIFWRKKKLDSIIIKRLGIVVLLAALAASLGWIMVASGLINRPWVNAYKLAIHLSIGISVYAYLFWTYLHAAVPKSNTIYSKRTKKWTKVLFWGICTQIFLGGIMSGMKAGLVFPTWPLIGTSYIPSILLQASEWNVQNFLNYDTGIFAIALIQVLHRTVAYLLFGFGIYYVYKNWNEAASQRIKNGLVFFAVVLMSQVTLGIYTLLYCMGSIPLLLGVLHQGTAIVLLSSILYLLHLYSNETTNVTNG